MAAIDYSPETKQSESEYSTNEATAPREMNLYNLVDTLMWLKRSFPKDDEDYRTNIMIAYELGTREADLLKQAHKRLKDKDKNR